MEAGIADHVWSIEEIVGLLGYEEAMLVKILDIKNAQSTFGSWTIAIPVDRVGLSVVVGAECQAELKTRGESFTGKGPSVVLAIQDLAANITNAAIKKERRGRTPDRVRLAASLLHGGPN